MELKDLKSELKKSLDIYEKSIRDKETIIKEEIKQISKLLNYLSPALSEKIINGKKSYLIYVFAESQKKTVSPEVYFCEDGKIRYQVYLKEDYRSYNPTVEYEGSYAVLEAREMFAKRNGLEFTDVVEFLIERVDSLKDMAENTREGNDIRKQFLERFMKFSKGI